MTLGLKTAGFDVIGALDSSQLAVSTYKSNHRQTRTWCAKIQSVDPADIKRELKLKRRQLELLAGCPPCQGFSRIRTRNGERPIADKRNSLLDEFLRYVDALLPKAIMLENVPGFTRYWKFEKFCSALRRLRYTVDYRIVDSKFFGVPQRRRRLILLASRFGPIAFPKPLSHVVTVRDAIGKMPKPGKTGDAAHDHLEFRSEKVVNIIKCIPKNGGSRADLGFGRQLNCHKRVYGFTDIYGRMSWDDVAPTITGGCCSPSKGRFLHPDQNRTISLREAALLQGFPVEYNVDMSKGKYSAAEMIGNAIPPKLVKIHAHAIYEGLQRKCR